jgi:hypothetical protein
MSDQLPPAPPPPPDSPDQPPYGRAPYGQTPYGADPYGGLRAEPQLQLDVHGLRSQKRWTVLIRVILALPQLIVLYFLLLATFFVMIVGWFAALFTGRLPDGIREFLTGVLRYQVRVHGYLLLLVDEYPPFVFFDAPDYPIQVEVPPATRLNRAAVLFRVILMIPAWIVSGVVLEGWGVIAFFVWLIMLFTGRQPEPVFGATSAALRYETRFLAYAGMLTPTYPKGLFGEVPGVEDRRSPTRPLLLSSGARVLLIVLIVLGAIAAIWSGSGNNTWSDDDSWGRVHSASQPR